MIRHVWCVELNLCPAVWLKYFVACSVAPGGGYLSAAQKASWSQPKIIQKFAGEPRHPRMGEVDDEFFSKVLPQVIMVVRSKMGGKISNMIGSSFHLGPGVVFHWTWMREPNCFYVGDNCQRSYLELPTFGGHVKWEKFLSLVGCDETRELLPQEMSAKHAQDRHFCFCYFHG